MKYCLINNLYPPYQRGGAEKIVNLLAEGLKEQNEVLVITSELDHSFSVLQYPGIEIYRLDVGNIYPLLEDYKQNFRRKIFWHFIDLFNFKLARQIKKIVKKAQVDYILTHNLIGLSLRTFAGLNRINKPKIHTLHDYQLLDPQGTMFRNGQAAELSNIFYKIYRFFTKRLTNKIKAVIAPSEFILKKHQEYGFFKNAYCKQIFNPIKTESQLITKEPSDLLKILYLGQMEEHKGVKFLVNSFLNWQNQNAVLYLAGNGSQMDDLKRLGLGDKRIYFLGKLNSQEIKKLFALTDILVVPSLWWENSPTVVYEAYNYGTPVLVSNSGGTKELVKEGQTGWVYKSGNEVDLIDKLQHIYESKNLLDAMGKNCQEFVANLSLDNYLQKLTDICKNLKN